MPSLQVLQTSLHPLPPLASPLAHSRPEDASLPPCPGRLAHPGGGAAADGAQWDPWAVLQLCADGEEVTGRVFLPQYLLAGAQTRGGGSPRLLSAAAVAPRSLVLIG